MRVQIMTHSFRFNILRRRWRAKIKCIYTPPPPLSRSLRDVRPLYLFLSLSLPYRAMPPYCTYYVAPTQTQPAAGTRTLLSRSSCSKYATTAVPPRPPDAGGALVRERYADRCSRGSRCSCGTWVISLLVTLSSSSERKWRSQKGSLLLLFLCALTDH